MDNLANTDHPVHDLIRQRWSPRAFREESLTKDEILSLLEAARWSASCFNEQPWRFVVALRSDKEAFDTMLGCLVEKNQSWAKSAGALLIAVSRNSFTHNENANRHAAYDTGAASATLTLQAMSMGLYVHQMAGFSSDAARERYAIPEGYEPIAAIAVGHMGDPQSLPDGLREREGAERTRKPLSELAFAGAFGTPFIDE